MNREWIRRAAALPLRYASYWSGSALLQSKAIRKPRILMYHALGEDGVSARRLAWQLRFLRREFEPVALGTLVSRLQEGTISGREVALTFDDGVRNHFTTVWPLLRESGVPATFFVCSGLTSSNTWMWTADLRLRLGLMGDVERVRLAHEAGCPDTIIEAIMNWAKRLPLHERQAFQLALAAHTRHFSPSEEQIERYAPLSWEQLRQLDPLLITIGSHTSTHPILTTVPEQQLQEEIVGSRKALEQGLDRRVDLFCYPNGISNPAVVEIVRHNYRAAVTDMERLVVKEDDLHTLPRVPAGGSAAVFTRHLHKPSA